MSVINFTNPTKSDRVNPIDPIYLDSISYAVEYTNAIYNNLTPEILSGKGDLFWSRSAKSVFQAIMWFLKKHYPEYCTIPHCIAMCMHSDFDNVLNLLASDVESRGLISSLLSASQKKASDLEQSMTASLKIPLNRLLTKEIFWILSGNDFNLDLNDPENPKFLCLGSTPTLSDTFSPVVSLIITVASKLLNQQNKLKSIILLDEGPTIYIPNLEQIPATARSNKVSVVFMAQDISQIRDKYGKTKTDTILANLNNQFFGRVSHQETANYISRLFGREDKTIVSKSSGSSISTRYDTRSDTVSHSLQERQVLKEQDIIGLQPGQFVGTVVETKEAYFKGKLKVNDFDKSEIPDLASGFDLDDNFNNIFSDIDSILYGPQKKKLKDAKIYDVK